MEALYRDKNIELYEIERFKDRTKCYLKRKAIINDAQLYENTFDFLFEEYSTSLSNQILEQEYSLKLLVHNTWLDSGSIEDLISQLEEYNIIRDGDKLTKILNNPPYINGSIDPLQSLSINDDLLDKLADALEQFLGNKVNLNIKTFRINEFGEREAVDSIDDLFKNKKDENIDEEEDKN